MINKNEMVPDKTIAIVKDLHEISNERIKNIFSPIDKKREWFTPHFYRCLPLTIGNTYGFIIKSEYDMTLEWDGTDGKDCIKIHTYEDTSRLYPKIESHFGSGILTITPPFMLRTPPGINLMTISPPNYILPGITVMTGIVETDNLRNQFTFNLKLQIPNAKIDIAKGFPLAAVIPVPRYYIDEFKIEFDNNIFSQETITEELNALTDFAILRNEIEPTMKNGVNRLYLKGKDIYNNTFKDHQGP